MDNLTGARPSRPIILDVKSEYGNDICHNRKKKHRRRSKKNGYKIETQPHSQQYQSVENEPSERDVNDGSLPLELQPLIRAAIAYGSTTHAYGARRGAQTLEDIAKQIRSIAENNPLLENIAKKAEQEAKILKNLLVESYTNI